MTDRKKVLKGLECCIASWCEACAKDCPYRETCYKTEPMNVMKPVMVDALELLKEQPQIVRCKDCKHRPTYPEAYGANVNGEWCYWCELHGAWKHDDWFCADGEVKQDGIHNQ